MTTSLAVINYFYVGINVENILYGEYCDMYYEMLRLSGPSHRRRVDTLLQDHVHLAEQARNAKEIQYILRALQ